VLNVCSWEASPTQPLAEYGASEDKSALANAAAMPNELISKLTHRKSEIADAHLVAGMLLGKVNSPRDPTAFLAQHGL
jgi:hypothetical protein